MSDFRDENDRPSREPVPDGVVVNPDQDPGTDDPTGGVPEGVEVSTPEVAEGGVDLVIDDVVTASDAGLHGARPPRAEPPSTVDIAEAAEGDDAR